MLENYKFEALMNYFKSIKNDNNIVLTYDDIEKILGFKLKPSAYKYSAYWRQSETHTITRAWIESGWNIEELKLAKYVRFSKVDA